MRIIKLGQGLEDKLQNQNLVLSTNSWYQPLKIKLSS